MSYRQLVQQIHPPKELNERVLQEARRISAAPVPRRRRLRPAACLAALCLIAGVFLYPRTAPTPFGGLTITASAAQLPGENQNGGLGLALERDGSNTCLFRISGTGIETLSLALEGGTLFHPGTTEALAVIRESYLPDAKYGLRLDGASGTLSVTANRGQTFRYLLTREDLRLSQSADGQTTLVPLLDGDPAQPLSGIYAVNQDTGRWFAWPLENARTIDLSQPYGPAANGTFHAGMDLPAPAGTPILAPADGTVTEIGFSPEEGRYLVLDHGNGLVTRYHHCSETIAREGASVQAGTAIALVGKTGMATGSHLHFEVLQDGVAQDPTPYFDAELRSQLRME